MKKILCIVLTILLALTVCGCKSEEAKNADNLISAIGTVTLESEAKINEAQKAVDALTDKDKKQLDNLDTLNNAHITYEALLVDDRISAITTVSIENRGVIADVRKMYDGCSPEVQALVTKLSALEDAETQLNALLVAEVEGLINSIGDVTIEDENAIKNARDYLNNLSEDNASKVSNVALLDAAEIALKDAKMKQAEKLLANMRVETDKVRGMSFYYSKTQPYYADVRCYVLPYIGRQGDRTWLCAQYHYMSYDSWVFWKTITFAVDDKRYYKFYTRSDIVRDNDTEVWEYVNTADVSESDIELFWAIANSKERIVRFEGDEYHHDFMVSAKDKKAIREILTAYEALQAASNN
jgi:hypothetical protein